MSKILCIIDGMTDSDFDVKEYEHLSSMKFSHYEDTCKGCEPETLTCVMHILGAANVPKSLRGYVEALGVGILINENDLILRGSWFEVDEEGYCTIPCEAPAEITGGICNYYSFDRYKCLLIYPGMADWLEKIKTYPPCNWEKQKADNLCPKGCPALQSLFTESRGKDRVLIPWGQSTVARVNSFPEKAAVVSGTTIVKGIGRLLNMDVIEVEGATGDTDTNLCNKVMKALETAEKYPLVLLHINGADEAAHRKNPMEKKQFLRNVDALVLAPLRTSAHEVIVISDHGTDPYSGVHTGEYQPVYIKKN